MHMQRMSHAEHELLLFWIIVVGSGRESERVAEFTECCIQEILFKGYESWLSRKSLILRPRIGLEDFKQASLVWRSTTYEVAFWI